MTILSSYTAMYLYEIYIITYSRGPAGRFRDLGDGAGSGRTYQGPQDEWGPRITSKIPPGKSGPCETDQGPGPLSPGPS